MDRVDQAQSGEITARLRGLMILLDDRLPARALAFVAEFIDHHEWGEALEMMADALCEDEVPVPLRTLNEPTCGRLLSA